MREIRLFLVDDEPQVRRGLRMRLQMEPDFVIVGEAGDGQEALDTVTAAMPDAVLMDLNLDGEDGVMVTGELRRAVPGCAVIAVSMRDDAATRARAFAAGAVAFISKYLIDQALTETIRSAVRDMERGPGAETESTGPRNDERAREPW